MEAPDGSPALTAPDPIQEARETMVTWGSWIGVQPGVDVEGAEDEYQRDLIAFERAVILSHDEKVKALKDAARAYLRARALMQGADSLGALEMKGRVTNAEDDMRRALAALEEQAP